jgi:glycosyltransferase involved in cell wall biosynthesis
MVLKELRIVASHPVQYHVPYYRSLVDVGLDVEVGYYHQGMAGQTQYDADFGLEYAWDIDLLSGYRKTVFLDHLAGYSLQEQFRLSAQLLPWLLRGHKAPVLFMGWFSEIIWLGWLLRILFRMPTLQFCETTEMSFRAGRKPRWRVALLGWLLRHSSAVLYIGSRNRDFLLGMGVAEQRLFPALYSVANEFFASSASELMKSRRELCREHGLDPDLPVFLFCGKLIPKKKPLELLQAYCEAGLIHQAQLLFVGDGMLGRRSNIKLERPMREMFACSDF